MNCKDDMAVDGLVKIEVDMSQCAEEVVYPPIVIQPVLQSTRRHSPRTVKKRSLLLPGEFDNDVSTSTRISKCCQVMSCPEPVRDNTGDGHDAEDTSDMIVPVSEVFDVKPDALPAPKKRTYCRRQQPKKSTAKRNLPATSPNSAESVGKLLGQLVSAYCGNDGHPANCKECKNRIEMVRALLESSGKCHQDANTSGDDSAANVTVSATSEEALDTDTTQAGLFCCAKCSDRFNTFDEWQKHEKMHSKGKKKCRICLRYLAAGTSLAVVSKQFYCLLQRYSVHAVRCFCTAKQYKVKLSD